MPNERGGAQAAFEREYERLYGEARGFAMRFVGTVWCDDVVQDAFLALWQSCYEDGDVPTASIDSLFYKILRRRIIDRLREQTVRDELSAAASGMGEMIGVGQGDLRVRAITERIENQTNTARVADGEMLAARITYLASTLTPKTRKVFEAGQLNGFDAHATAASLGMSYDAARWHQKEALNRMRAALERDGYPVPAALRAGRRVGSGGSGGSGGGGGREDGRSRNEAVRGKEEQS